MIGAVALGVLVAVGTGLLASVAPAAAADHEGQIKVDVDNQMAANVQFCIKTDTSKTYPAGSDRACSGSLMMRKTATLWVDGKPNDRVYLDLEIYGEHTHNDLDITGGNQCTVTGDLVVAKLRCNSPQVENSFGVPTVKPYSINVDDPNSPGMSLLNLLAWCVSAAGVTGLLITGLNLAMQLRRGEPGEFGEHWRGLVMVGAACLLGAVAGPLVEFIHPIPS
ncbi:hypothetical protein [Micromonospora zhanjiangensis]|uniref:Uncharacterized protein n=1 Tax=Micromonospora zhanjiangensis TaxID=1522057 RepID=A0ABV8KTI8_9ACTN